MPVTGFPPNSVVGITAVALLLFVIMTFFTIRLSSYLWIMRIMCRSKKMGHGIMQQPQFVPQAVGLFNMQLWDGYE